MITIKRLGRLFPQSQIRLLVTQQHKLPEQKPICSLAYLQDNLDQIHAMPRNLW